MASDFQRCEAPTLAHVPQLFILGDSYSDVGWYTNSPLPTKDQPMGMDGPGAEILAVGGKIHDNWVVHLSRSRQSAQHGLLIYDVARSGDTMLGLERQVQRVQKLVEGGVTVGKDAILVIWIGINDVAVSDESSYSDRMEMLDGYMVELHGLGLRHLILFDVPPRMPLPAGYPSHIGARINKWNDLLPDRLSHWQALPNTTGRSFSTHRVFSDILSNPISYSFTKSDPSKVSGEIWLDGLHPTEDVHLIVADEFEAFLAGEKGRG